MFNLIMKIQNDCEELGIVLGIDREILTSFKQGVSPKDKCTTILHKWIQRGKGDYEVTWDGLLKALNDSGLGGIAKHFEKALIFHALKICKFNLVSIFSCSACVLCEHFQHATTSLRCVYLYLYDMCMYLASICQLVQVRTRPRSQCIFYMN